jgi:hypothetical protein
MSGKIEYPRILWLLACTDSICDHLQPIYAISEEDAQRQAREWLEQRPSLKCISLRPYPRGFMLQHEILPGEL